MNKKDILNKVHDKLYLLSLKNIIKLKKTINDDHFYLNKGKRIIVKNFLNKIDYYNGINTKNINTMEECEKYIKDFLK